MHVSAGWLATQDLGNRVLQPGPCCARSLGGPSAHYEASVASWRRKYVSDVVGLKLRCSDGADLNGLAQPARFLVIVAGFVIITMGSTPLPDANGEEHLMRGQIPAL